MVRRLLARVMAGLRGGLPLTELPLGLPGRLYRAAMPFSGYDRSGALLGAFREHGVSMIVVLTQPDECLDAAGCDLLELYTADRYDVIQVPAPDFGVPAQDVLATAVARALEALRAGRHVAAHCHAGKGRTGIFAACVAREALGLDADQAIEWIRRYVPGAVENPGQMAAIRRYQPSAH
jgi:protein-tyrosine phosphatase